jgi:hypothetical protein
MSKLPIVGAITDQQSFAVERYFVKKSLDVVAGPGPLIPTEYSRQGSPRFGRVVGPPNGSATP